MVPIMVEYRRGYMVRSDDTTVIAAAAAAAVSSSLFDLRSL